jgi:hypothetical protein
MGDAFGDNTMSADFLGDSIANGRWTNYQHITVGWTAVRY